MNEEKCVLAATSDFPCAGTVRTEWYGLVSIEVCAGHRQRAACDSVEDHDDGALAMWNAR